jgi:hypothetical protein
LDSGFKLVCYDATQFRTMAGITVWAIPVLLLPFRSLLAIGDALNSVSAKDLQAAVDEAFIKIPERLLQSLVTHLDRGSAMKSRSTKEHLQELGLAVHCGRPHTPDDEPWIEALNKSLKYHRDCPDSFAQGDDVLRWFGTFLHIHNNEPHSALKFVSPQQALDGKQEVILAQRTQKLLLARRQRLDSYRANVPMFAPEPEVRISSL